MSESVFLREGRNARRFGETFDFGLPTLGCRSRARHVHPKKSVALLTRKCAGVDAVHLQLGIFRNRRDLAALSALRLEAPAVIAALHLLAVESSVGERDTTVRAAVAHRKSSTVALAPDHQRRSQQHHWLHPLAADLARTQRAVPESVKPVGGGLGLCGARHGDDLN